MIHITTDLCVPLPFQQVQTLELAQDQEERVRVAIQAASLRNQNRHLSR